jgi:EpsG family
VLGWLVLLILMLACDLGLDRSFFIDQQSYLENFSQAATLDWVQKSFSGSSLLTSILVGVFSEEILWQIWATALGSVLSPSAAVFATACAISLMVADAVRRLPDPVMPLVLWLLLPVGFVLTGLLQLRQGFAFAVMLYVSLRLNRPVLGALLASMIHSTFVLPLAFAGISWLCGRRQLFAVLLVVILALVTAYLGGLLFEVFGGRRLAIYSVNEAETNSILYVFGALLCSLPSLHRLLVPTGTPLVAPPTRNLDRALTNLAVVHVGVIAFTVFCFFMFPLGAGRIGYLIMLLLIPILPTMRRRHSVSGATLYALLLMYLVYLTIKTFLEGPYNILFAG